MSAIEMMDPKMDAGMMCNQAKRKVLDFDKSVEVRYFFKREFATLETRYDMVVVLQAT